MNQVDALKLAHEHEHAGRLADAEKICRAILDENPNVSASWNLLGMIAARTGKPEAAADLIARAIAVDPKSAALHSNLGELRRRMGRVDDALNAFQTAADLDPNSAQIQSSLGSVLRQKGHPAQSLAAFDRALQLDPALANAHNNRGNVLRDLGRFDEAIAAYGRALNLNSRFAPAHANLANVLAEQEKFAEAISEYRAALKIQPEYPEALINLANALRATEKFAEAETAVGDALRLKPQFPEAYINLGIIFHDQSRIGEAIQSFQTAIRLDPSSAMAYNNLASALAGAGQTETAIRAAKTAVNLDPDYADAYNSLGNLLANEGQYDEAQAAFASAIQLRPDLALAHWNRSLVFLLRGDFETGWAEHEWRKRTRVKSRPRDFSQPQWTGGDIAGRKILIHCEQGFGDTIQFIRYAPLVAQRGAHVLINCPIELADLFRASFAAIEVISGDPPPNFDVHCPLLSLPFIFKTRLQTIPAQIPYLLTPPDRLGIWRNLVQPAPGELRVGLAWAGNPTRKLDRRRSLSPEQLPPLTKIPGVRIYSLQKTNSTTPSETASELVDLAPRLLDFADTAALIQQLDLVISVDTAVAHLAGALGKPVWLLLGFVPAWRWMLDRTGSPWYPTMRLFRQPTMDDWNTPIAVVANALTELAQRGLNR